MPNIVVATGVVIPPMPLVCSGYGSFDPTCAISL